MNNIQIDVIDNFFDVELQDEIFEKIKSSKWSFNGGSLKNPIWHADNLEQDKFFSHYVQDLILKKFNLINSKCIISRRIMVMEPDNIWRL